METGVARMNCAARSSQWNSGRLRIMSMRRWPGLTPSAWRPAAAFATRWATSAQVHSCQLPGASPTILRSATWSG